jgi:hypothetical protein
VEEDLRKSASFDEFRNLEKIVDSLPTHVSISALEDKFKEYTRLGPFTHWQNTVNSKLVQLVENQTVAVTQTELN